MLTNQEIQQFHEEGYLIFESLICGEKLKSYVAIFDELIQRSREVPIGTPHWSFELDDDHQQIAGFLHKIQGVCVVEPRILSLAKSRKFFPASKP